MRFNIGSMYSVEVLDLHGNYFRGDPANGDTNVFEIKPGVCISILARVSGGQGKRYVHYDEMRGADNSKLQKLLKYGRHRGTKVNPIKPFFYFTPQSDEGKEYISFNAVSEIFQAGTLGMMTGKDHFMIAYTADDMRSRINEITDTGIPIDELRQKYNLADSRDWVLRKAREIILDEGCIESVCYRPFDIRFTYYDKRALASPQSRVNEPLRDDGNIALCVPRQLASLPFRHALVSDCVTEMSYISNRTKEANRVFPLYMSDKAKDMTLLPQSRQLNLRPEFLRSLSQSLGLKSCGNEGLPEGVSPKSLFL
jgi:predicted helicase